MPDVLEQNRKLEPTCASGYRYSLWLLRSRQEAMRATDVDADGPENTNRPTDCGLDSDESALVATMPYRQTVDELLSLAHLTRPDIVFELMQTARHSLRPRTVACNAIDS